MIVICTHTRTSTHAYTHTRTHPHTYFQAVWVYHSAESVTKERTLSSSSTFLKSICLTKKDERAECEQNANPKPQPSVSEGLGPSGIKLRLLWESPPSRGLPPSLSQKRLGGLAITDDEPRGSSHFRAAGQRSRYLQHTDSFSTHTRLWELILLFPPPFTDVKTKPQKG